MSNTEEIFTLMQREIVELKRQLRLEQQLRMRDAQDDRSNHSSLSYDDRELNQIDQGNVAPQNTYVVNNNGQEMYQNQNTNQQGMNTNLNRAFMDTSSNRLNRGSYQLQLQNEGDQNPNPRANIVQDTYLDSSFDDGASIVSSVTHRENWNDQRGNLQRHQGMNNLVDIDNSRDNNRANGNVIVEDTIDLINFQIDDQNIHQNQQGRNLPRHFNAQQSSTQLNQQTFNDLNRVTSLASQYENHQR